MISAKNWLEKKKPKKIKPFDFSPKFDVDLKHDFSGGNKYLFFIFGDFPEPGNDLVISTSCPVHMYRSTCRQ